MTTSSDVYAVVPAAGFGKRMRTAYPKQYLSIAGKTILEHSVEALLSNSCISHVVVVISPKDTYFTSLKLSKHPQVTVVDGGVERAYSVLAGIQSVDQAKWVIVHDAARPCLCQEDLKRLLAIGKTSKVGGILVKPVLDTMKRSDPRKRFIFQTVDRIGLWHALTPQFFPRKLLYDCLQYALNQGVTITDESSALEYCGFYPKLVKGRPDNIKVTYPEDLHLAEFYLTCAKRDMYNAYWTRF